MEAFYGLQQINIMLNYIKNRESVQKTPSKKSLNRCNINKSHISSVNIKLNIKSHIDNHKITSIKSIFDQKFHPSPQPSKPLQANPFDQSRKNSIKLTQFNEKQNTPIKKETPYKKHSNNKNNDSNNIYLQTDRIMLNERSDIKKKGLKIRLDNNEMNIKTQYCEKTSMNYFPERPEKESKTVKISLFQMQELVSQIYMNKNEISQLQRQLKFYKKHANSNNTALIAMRT